MSNIEEALQTLSTAGQSKLGSNGKVSDGHLEEQLASFIAKAIKVNYSQSLDSLGQSIVHRLNLYKHFSVYHNSDMLTESNRGREVQVNKPILRPQRQEQF